MRAWACRGGRCLFRRAVISFSVGFPARAHADQTELETIARLREFSPELDRGYLVRRFASELSNYIEVVVNLTQ